MKGQHIVPLLVKMVVENPDRSCQNLNDQIEEPGYIKILKVDKEIEHNYIYCVIHVCNQCNCF